MQHRGSAALTLLLVGCGAAGSRGTAVDRPALARAHIVLARTREEITFERLIDGLVRARVVYVGERHDRVGDHRIQAAILDALYQRQPHLALGFEMIQRPFQPALSRYARGETDETELQERVEWSGRWGFDFTMYEPLLRYGPDHGVRLVALNAPQETTRTIARGGLEALADAVREALPELDREQPAHRARVAEALRAHPGMTEAAFERFYTAQLVWDETMATQVAQTLREPDPPALMVVFAGVMHTARDAIPERAARRGARPLLVVELADEMPAEVTADYVWLTEPQ